ncbi:MAG TPA: glutamate--tRNA ligase, partial [Cyanobacteria bacterium UBA11691]|nr:glutamate--tRNA ligase [Cyanobacteria bacterium UBA11691]
LDDMRAKQKAAGLAPRYDNRHRNLTADEQAAFEAEGRKPVIRFRIDDDRTIVWKDLVRGTVSWKASDLGGDMVVARAAEAGGVGQPLYNLAVVVDDMDMTITHVIRGEDHIANTAKQILLYEAFGGQVPEFAHTPLILNQDGRKLSKRDGVTSISDFRQMGYIAPALANYMTLLGWTAPDATQEIFTLDEAAQTFTFDRVNQAGAKFDWDKLNWINSQYLHHLPIPELTDLILPVWQEAGFATDSEERSWLEQIVALIGPSLTRLPEAVELAQMFFSQEINFSEEATEQLQKEGVKEILESLLATVEGQSATEDTLKDAIKAVTKEKKVKKGLVMRSLRAALTGEVHGPDLIQSWLLWNQKGQDSDRIKQSLKTLASSV